MGGINLASFARGNRRLIAYVKARTDLTWKKTGGAAAGVAFFWPVVGHWVPTAVTTAAAGWTVAALIAGQNDQPAAADTEDGPEPTIPTPTDVHALTVSLTAGGRNVLLTRLAADLGDAHPGWEPSTKTVKALLSEAGIPFREGVRAPDGKNGPGVHHTDVPPLPSPSEAPSAGVVGDVGAGQSANTNANNTEQHPFRALPDPGGNPHRTVIEWDDQPARQAS